MATLNKNSPDSTSSDYDFMLPYWDKVEDIVAGREAVIAAGKKYLPRFAEEDDTDYDERIALARFTNFYRDIVENLAGKPFSEELSMADGTSDRVKELAEDIDGKGNNIHVFASSVFFHGINSAIDWILVDYSRAPAGQVLSQADEQRLGLRPYWVRVPAKRMLMVVTARIGSTEEVVYARILETEKRRKGFGEEKINRIREFERPATSIVDPVTGAEIGVAYGPAKYRVLEAREHVVGSELSVGTNTKVDWVQVDAGPISIGIIPLVPYLTGRRHGNSWKIDPVMKDAADLQIEHYQAESALKYALAYCAFPILVGSGFNPDIDPATKKPVKLKRSPKTVLYAPPGKLEGQMTDWKFLEVAGSTIEKLQKDVDHLEAQLREIGRQPMTNSVANMTAATAGGAAQKSNTAVKAWALGLKDALERAFVFTCMWLNTEEQPEVTIYTDFDILDEDTSGPTNILALRKNGDLSQKTTWQEFKRRGTLSADFDPDEEIKALEDEEPTPEDINEQRAAMGLPPLPDPNADPNALQDDPNAPPGQQPPAKKPPASRQQPTE
jgi:hypothetical protein